MNKISTLIARLAAEPSTNKKTEILINNCDNALLKEAFFMTLDPFTNYFITTKIPEKSGTKILDLGTLLDVKAKLAGRVITGHAARDYLNNIMVELDPDEQVILKRIINHDLECKVGGSLVNRAWMGLILEFPVMLAEKFTDKATKYIPEGPNAIIVQKKVDGGRVEIVVNNDGAVSVYSRNGNLLLTHGVFDAMFEPYINQVFDGELLVIDKNGINDRKTGNGYFNKAVRQTITAEEAAKFHVVMWDVIPLADWKAGFCKIPYATRLNTLIDFQKSMNMGKTSIVETRFVSTYSEVHQFYAEMLALKEEGAMVKPADMIWEATRSNYCLKLKEIKDAALLCVSITPHSKDPSLIGSLDCETSDGLLKVSIGVGLNDIDRARDPSYFIGSIIDMVYNALITSKSNKHVSMFLPVYKGIRTDKDVADTLAHLKK